MNLPQGRWSAQIDLRVALGYLSLVTAQIGFWALLAPRSCYDGFPGPGRAWVAADGPHNEHLIRDVGALNLALLVVLVAAAVKLTRQLLMIAAVATAAWGVPHLLYHLFNTDNLATDDLLLSIGGLVAFVGFSVVLAISARNPNLART